MSIANIKASVHEFPLRVPLFDEPLEARQLVVCEVETDDGLVGYGLTGYGVRGNFLPSSVVSALHHDFLPLVRGMDVRDVEAIHERVWKVLNPRAMTGVISSSLSCLDIALWDIHGKYSGRSIAHLLGGFRDWAPTYVTFGLADYDEDQLVEAARLQVAEGHRRLKMVVGVAPGGPAEDARRVRAVREVVGDDVELMIDANHMFSPVEAFLLCRAVSAFNLTWFEEPLYQNDARALRDLRGRAPVPLAAGQMEGNRWRLRELVVNESVDFLQPNASYCGGYTEARKAAHVAQAFNLPVANGGGWPRINMHTMAGLMNGTLVEFHIGMKSIEDQIFIDPPEAHDNVVRLPNRPGLGMDVNKDVLRATAVEA